MLSRFVALVCLFHVSFIQVSISQQTSDEKDVLQVFYHKRPPSMETLKGFKDFIKPYENQYIIKYYLITDDANNELLTSLGLPEAHFPFAIAINGKTSALIEGDTIVFVKLPDFMHHIGRRQGNWTLKHLETVLSNKDLFLPENPVIRTEAMQH